MKGKKEACSDLAVLIIQRMKEEIPTSHLEKKTRIWPGQCNHISSQTQKMTGKRFVKRIIQVRGFICSLKSKGIQFLMPFKFYGLPLVYLF